MFKTNFARMVQTLVLTRKLPLVGHDIHSPGHGGSFGFDTCLAFDSTIFSSVPQGLTYMWSSVGLAHMSAPWKHRVSAAMQCIASKTSH